MEDKNFKSDKEVNCLNANESVQEVPNVSLDKEVQGQLNFEGTPDATVLQTVTLSTDKICYSQFRARIGMQGSIWLSNQNEELIGGTLSIFSKPVPYFRPLTLTIPKFKGDKYITQALELDPVTLSRISEEVEASVIVCFTSDDGKIKNNQISKVITVFPYNHWSGNEKELAVFVTPNAEEVGKLSYLVSQKMQKRGDSPELDGYSKGDPKRIECFCASVYDTLLDLKITYSLPPKNFTGEGQNIRMVDSVVSSHIATCIDSTLLFASILEAIHLNPFVVLVPGHAFVGCWLRDENLDSPTSNDSSILVSRLIGNKRSICLIETTLITSSTSFAFACKSAEEEAEKSKGQLTIVDIENCRNLNILPIQMDRYSEKGKVELYEDTDHMSKLELDSNDYGPENDVSLVFEKETDKIVYWSKKLLDLSTRNVLINLNPKRKKTITFLNNNPATLEDKLFLNTEFSFMPSPLENPIQNFNVVPLTEEGTKTLITKAFENNTLIVNHDENDLLKRLKEIMYQANSDLNETGANTLFLGIGLLNWYEKKISRFAPIILMPVELVRVSSKNYKLRKRDEDCILNYSIVEKLKQDYQVNIPYNNQNLPTDDSGLDINKVLLTFRKCIEKIPNWVVIPYSVLGVFSFSQFIIYNDLLSRRDVLEKHKITSSLIKNHLEFEYTPIPEISDDDIKSMVLPVSCDESQLRAVKAAKEGCSFVLQGPPGTGKSQTITSIIADCLASDKKVLFVAEKKAALDVVQRNLNQIGLKEFVLELHSTKATKEHVVAQFEEALHDDHKASITSYSQLVADISDRRSKLNQIVNEINKERVNGLSLYDLISRMVAAEEKSNRQLLIDPELAATISEIERNNIVEKLQYYSKEVSRFAPMSENSCGKLYLMIGGDKDLNSVKKEVMAFLKTEELKKQQENYLVSNYPFLRPTFLASEAEVIKKLSLLKDCLSSIQALNVPVYFLNCNQKLILPKMLKYAEAQETERIEKQKIPVKFDEEIFDYTVIKELQRQLREMLQAGFFQKTSIQNKILHSLQSYSSEKIAKDQIASLVNSLVSSMNSVQEKKKAMEGLPYDVLCLLNSDSLTESSIGSLCSKLASLDKQMNSISATLPDLTSASVMLLVKEPEIVDKLSKVVDLLEKRQQFNDRQLLSQGTPKLNEICMALNEADASDYQAYCQLMTHRQELIESTKAIEFITAIDEKKLSTKEIADDFELAYYRTLVKKIICESKVLDFFDNEINRIQIEKYQKCEKDYTVTARQELLNHLEKNKPDSSANINQIAQIKRIIATRGKGLSIRDFFKKIPDFYFRFFPCFLMSPLSVAQFLDPSLPNFDVVIFDEASQLTTSKAVGAISRANQVIVVGDTKQMPPTSFFQKKDDNDDMYSNFDFEADLESILNDVIAINMPEVLLSWHYRSRHESLIQFSNSHYYQNRLKTYPSVDAYNSHVSFVKVNGFYYPKSSEPNPEEVKAVTNEINRRLSDDTLSKKSIGVITFNERQQNAIRERLDNFFDAYPKLAEKSHWYDDSDEYAETRLFVKNIENVQGDERDVILFSTCFGPTEENPDRIDLRFGPIQQAGGERRLNVAFSRAKEEMVIFSIMNPSDLSKRDLKSKGLQDLSAFLMYAADKDSQSSKSLLAPDAAKRFIGKRLESHGYKIAYDIGDSSFKIDIGIYADNGKTFKTGIALDGPVFYSARTSRDREILRPLFLKTRGWKMVRTSIIDWYHDSDRAEQNLVENLEKVEIDNQIEEEVPKESDVGEVKKQIDLCVNQQTSESSYREEEYKNPRLTHSVVGFDINNSFTEIIELLNQLISDFGPVQEHRIVKEVASAYGISRVGNNIQMTFSQAFVALKRNGITCTSQSVRIGDEEPDVERFYWPLAISPENYHSFRKSSGSDRNIDEIPFQEICNFISYKLERCFVLEYDDIYTLIQEEFGLKKSTERFKAFANAAVEYGIKTKQFIKRKDGKIEHCSFSNLL
ncbi:MAG: DUF4011 domain-containing protein [Sphaerochaetaceae bacterium]